VSSGSEFLSSQERDILERAPELNRAVATQRMAQLAISLGLEATQTESVVAAFRRRAEELTDDQLKELDQHGAGLVAVLGVVALQAPAFEVPVSEQPVPVSAPDVAMPVPVAEEAVPPIDMMHEPTANAPLSRSVQKVISSIFGDTTELFGDDPDNMVLAPENVDVLAATIMALHGPVRFTRVKHFERFRALFSGVAYTQIADVTGEAIGQRSVYASVHQVVRDILVRHNYSQEESYKALDQALSASWDAAPATETTGPEVRDEAVVETSETEPETIVEPTESGAFSRLKEKLRQTFASNGVQLDDQMTLNQLEGSVITAYQREYAAASTDLNLIDCYVEYLRTDTEPRELAQRFGVQFNDFGRLMSCMPPLVADVLLEQHVDVLPIQPESVVVLPQEVTPVVTAPTPRNMPARQQPLVYQPSKYVQGRVTNNDEGSVTSPIVEDSVIVASEPIIVDMPALVEEPKMPAIAPEGEQVSGRQVIDTDPRTHDDLRIVTLALIKELHGFTEPEKKALRVRSLFGKQGAHADVSGDTLAAIRKIELHMVERDNAVVMPSELTDRTLKYFVSSPPNDLDTIYKKLQRSFPEVESKPRDVERWLALGLEAVFVS